MFGALFSFLGGSAFRMVWGEMSAYFTKRQEFANERETMRLQGELDAAAHGRMIELTRLQADLGVKTIEVQKDADVARAEAGAFAEAIRDAMKPTGIVWVDAWNGTIRPLAASIAIMLWVLALNEQGFKMGDWDKEIVGVILGFFFADRSLGKRGK